MPEKLPPLTIDHLITGPLADESFTVYLYIGGENEAGWENATLAFGVLPRLRIYLVEDAAIVAQWTNQDDIKGIVFGWNTTPVKLLSRQEADDFKIVLTEIQEARVKK